MEFWILMLLVAAQTESHTARIDMYVTLADCNTAKAKLERDFQQSYPDDHDYAFFCVLPKADKE